MVLYIYKMKKLSVFIFIFWGISSYSQIDSSYLNLLNKTSEINLVDSLTITTNADQLTSLDTLEVIKWFKLVIPGAGPNRIRKRDYYLIGKITNNENFDLLILMEQKKRIDSTSIQTAWLVTTRKDGKYIASLEVAVSGSKKQSTYNITSCLYKDLRVILNSTINASQATISENNIYNINKTGRFLLASRY